MSVRWKQRAPIPKEKINTKIMTYSSSLAMNRQRFSGRNQNAVAFKSKDKKLGPISNTIILIVLACLIGLLYLTQVTKTNAYGQKIYALQQQQTQLQSQHDDLVVATAQLQSLDRVQNSQIAGSLTTVSPSGTVTQ
jgi:hypothetical protein